MIGAIAPVRWTGERLLLLDQTLLPGREVEREYTRWEDVAEAIVWLVCGAATVTGELLMLDGGTHLGSRLV